MSEKMLELINVTKIFKSKEYKRKIYGLDNINISILEGEVVGVLGRRGAGKSTLLKIIGDKLKPSSGHINLNEEREFEIVYIDGEEIDGDETIIKALLAKTGDIYILDNVFEDFNKKDKDFFKIKLQELINGGKTIIISDYSLEFLNEICNTAIWVENGKVRMHDTYLRVNEAYVNFENRYKEMLDDEREELDEEWKTLRFVDEKLKDYGTEKKFKAPKIPQRDNNTKNLIKYGTAAIGVTLVLASGFILYNKINDNKVGAEEKPQVVAPKPDIVVEKVKYEKDMTFAFVMTSKFDNRNIGLREYLKDSTGEVIEGISIVTLKEDGFEVELQDLSPYVQVNFPSKKLNDQLRYSLLAENEEFLKGKIEKYSGKNLDGITVVDKATVVNGLKDSGVKFTGVDGSVTIDGNVIQLNTIEGKGNAAVQVLNKISSKEDLSSLGVKGDGVTFKKYKEIAKVQNEVINEDKEAEKKLTESHVEYLKTENKVGLKVEAKEVETKSVDLKSLLEGVRNIPAEYLTSKLVFVDDLDHNKNVIVQEIKKNSTQNSTSNNNRPNRPSTGGGTSGGATSGGGSGSTGGGGNQGGSGAGSGGATDGGSGSGSEGGQTGGGSGSGGNTGSGGETGGDSGSGGSGGSGGETGGGTEGGQTGGDGNQGGSDTGSGEALAE